MDGDAPQSGGKRDYLLPVSILIAAVLIAGSVFYAFGRSASNSGDKNYPNNAFTRCIDTQKYASAIQADKSQATADGVTGTPATFINGEFIGGAYPWATFQKSIEDGLKHPNSWPAQAVDVNGGGKVTDVPPPGSGDVILGDANAPVTIIEYGDYQCPFCGRFFSEVEPLIRSQYIQTGKAKMVFRNYPFLGPESDAAAEAAECAKDQGQYWAYHDALYSAKIQSPTENNGILNKDLFEKIASDLKLNAN